MARTLAILTMAATGIVSAYAGPVTFIQVGGNTGLTASTVTSSGFVESSGSSTYQNSTSGTGVGVNGQVVCSGGTPSTCVPGASTAKPTTGFSGNVYLTDSYNGSVFSMINETGCSNFNGSGTSTCGMWASPLNSTNTSTMTISLPGGVFGVTNVYTLISDLTATNSAQNQDPISVGFIFANALNNVSFNLYNGQVIRSNVVATTGAGTLGGNVINLGGGAYNDTTNPGTGCYDTNGLSASCVSITPTVSAFNVWNGTYSKVSGTQQGVLNIDAQNFYLGAGAASDTLLSIIITEHGSTSSTALVGAVTLQVPTATPEPASIFLAITGIGAAALLRRRQKQQ